MRSAIALLVLAATLVVAAPASSSSARTERLTFAEARAGARTIHRPWADSMTSSKTPATITVGPCARRSPTLIVCKVTVRGDQQTIRDRTMVRGGVSSLLVWVRDMSVTRHA